MSRVFVISDPHFGHSNIINVPGRLGLFSTPEEHDETLIDNWNSVVSKRDKVFLLGDVGFDRKGYVTNEVIPRLPGFIHVIGGNHDTAEILQKFYRSHGVVTYKHTVLTHIPIHPQEMYWDFNIHGHLHSNVVKKYANGPAEGSLDVIRERDIRYINVSCEQVGFTPVDLNNLIEENRVRYGEVINKNYPLPLGRNRR